MTHLQMVKPELIRSITENKQCYVVLSTKKRTYSENDILILEAEKQQLEVTITTVATEPGIMKGYAVVSFIVPEELQTEIVFDPLIFEPEITTGTPLPVLQETISDDIPF